VTSYKFANLKPEVAYLLVLSAVEIPSEDGLAVAARKIEDQPISLVRDLVTLVRLDGHTTIGVNRFAISSASGVCGGLVTQADPHMIMMGTRLERVCFHKLRVISPPFHYASRYLSASLFYNFHTESTCLRCHKVNLVPETSGKRSLPGSGSGAYRKAEFVAPRVIFGTSAPRNRSILRLTGELLVRHACIEFTIQCRASGES
jgi:hypothetical protein